jgi:hypothetical protein
MFAHRTRVLLILPRDLLDRARPGPGGEGDGQVQAPGEPAECPPPCSPTWQAGLSRQKTMSKWTGLTILAGAVAVMASGCSQQPSGALIEDKTSAVMPASVPVKAGIVPREQPINLEESRTEPSLKFSGHGASEGFDPGQEANQSLEMGVPRRSPEGEEAQGNPLGGIPLG